MLTKIKINLNCQPIDAILLCKFSMKVKIPKKRLVKFLWLKKEKFVYKNELRDFCIVYIPWKYRMKEIALIDSSLVLDNDLNFVDKTNIVKIDNFETSSNFYGKIKIHSFEGYNFIYADKNFISNMYACDKNECLSSLYNKMPEILAEEIDDSEILM